MHAAITPSQYTYGLMPKQAARVDLAFSINRQHLCVLTDVSAYNNRSLWNSLVLFFATVSLGDLFCKWLAISRCYLS